MFRLNNVATRYLSRGRLFVAVISIVDAFKTPLIVQRRLLSQAVEAEDEGTAALMSDCSRE